MRSNRLLSTFGRLRRGRLLLMLVLCVLLPTIPLGYLIMQIMMGESEDLSKRINDNLERVGAAMAAAATAGLSECEEDIEEPLRAELPLNDTVAEISEEITACPLFDSFFILDSDLRPLFPFGSMGREAPEINSAAAERDEKFAGEMKEGYRLEFDTGEIDGAVRMYSMALAYTRGTKYRAILENAIARCYLKSGEHQKAKSHYMAILGEGDGGVLYGGLSMGLLARYQLAEIEGLDGNAGGDAGQLLFILRSLARGEMAGSLYEAIFYASKIEEKLRGLLADNEIALRYRREYEEVMREWERRKGTALHTIQLPENARSDLRKLLREGGEGDGGFMKLAMAINGRETIILYRKQAITGIGGAILAVVLDPAAIRREVGAALNGILKTETDVYAAVYDSEGKVIAGEGSEFPASGYEIERRLGPALPDWRLRVAYGKEGLLFEVAERERITRFTSIFFLAAIIFLGLYVAQRSMRRDTELARLKSDFVSRVSHELRTPLATIRALGEILEMGAVSSREKEQEYFGLIASESERLSRLIDNVLDFSKIGSAGKTYIFRPADIGKTVSNTVLAFSQYAVPEGFDVRFEAEEGIPPAEIDEDAISQALINLLDNAVKFSREEKTVSVDLRTRGNEIRISVRDRGVGIEAANIDKIFDQFYRPKEAVELSGKGAGIGLAIVKHVAEAHGGRVEVTSRKGEGSVFTVVLPAGGAPS